MTNALVAETAGALLLPALVVDDEPQIRIFLADILEAEGFEVVAVADGQAALEFVNSSTPGLVLLDLRMQGLDGMETLKRLKATGIQAPVIILTGYGNIPSAVEAIRLGAYDYLTKPWQQARTARRLKVDYKTLHVKMKLYGIHARETSS